MSNEMGAPVRMQCVDRKPKRRGRPPKRLADDAGEQLAGLLPEEALQDALRGLDTEQITGPGGLITQLAGRVIEAALGAQLSEHLGYPPGQAPPGGAGNVRNGSTPKTLATDLGEVAVRTPRDRDASFQPRLVAKRQTRLAGLDDKILALYAGGLIVRDIETQLGELYGVQVGRDTISRVTDAVLADVQAWCSRPLDEIYAIVYLDALVVKVREDRSVRNRACYLAIGVNLQGEREVLGIWWRESEGAKFWLAVLNDLHQRGVRDVLICCVDGLEGFPEAIAAVFPEAWVQTCIVHQIRSGMRYVSYRDRKKVAVGVGLDGVRVCFDDERVVSDAGVMLVATLATRLGIEALAGRLVRLRRDRPGAAKAGRKVMALLFAMVLGADSIDDTDVLRAGRTRRLLGGWLPAPSTLGTFLRAFTFGHVRQLDALLGRALERAWKAGAGPGDGRLVIDVDSFLGEVCGALKQGAAYGYTKRFGYHPILATRADTREALHIRLRKGSANTQKGIKRFCEELIARVERAGATGPKLLRADSGFWNTKVFELLERAGWQYSIGVRNNRKVRAAIEAIPDARWQRIDYPAGGEAQIAETTYAGRRLVVRRTRLLGAQAELWPDWRHFAFLTNRTEEIALVEAEHRDHAVVEQVIADLKDQALAHFPSGHFYANAAWTVLAALAHNLLRWTQLLGLPDTTVRAARTLRRRLLAIPGRLTSHARGWTLHLPARWPWHGDYTRALDRIRALPAA